MLILVWQLVNFTLLWHWFLEGVAKNLVVFYWNIWYKFLDLSFMMLNFWLILFILTFFPKDFFRLVIILNTFLYKK